MVKTNFTPEYCHNISVLIVDDNYDVREFTEAILTSMGFKVTCAVDGRNGLEEYLKNSYDIVFTDIKMPYLDGIEMIKKIKSIQKDQHFIVTSAYGDVDNLTELLNIQVSGFLPKPSTLQHIQDVFLRVTKLLFFQKELEKYQKNLESMVNEQTTQLKVNEQRLKELESIIIKNKTYALVVKISPEKNVVYQTNNNSWFNFDFQDFFTGININPKIIDDNYNNNYEIEFNKFIVNDLDNFQSTVKLINSDTYVKIIISRTINEKSEKLLHFIFYDVSKERIKEEQLELFYQIIDQGNLGVLITNNEGNIHYSNQVFLSFCNKRLEEVIGRNFPANPERNPELKEILPAIFNGKKKTIRISKEGQKYKIYTFPVKNHAGNLTENRVVLIDKE